MYVQRLNDKNILMKKTIVVKIYCDYEQYKYFSIHMILRL